jgi:NAD(P)H-dependent FMN reductase
MLTLPQNPRIMAFAGSARTDSFNKRLLTIAVEGARSAGGEVTVVDLRDFPLPIYDGDCEAEHGLPDNALRLKEIMAANQGLLIAAPEYNSSITPLLKNTIDWVSRRDGQGRPGTLSVRGKVAALTAASPGGLGGLRGLTHVRTLLSNIGMFVLPDQLALQQAHKAFDDQGRLTDEPAAKRLDELTANFVRVVERLKA